MVDLEPREGRARTTSATTPRDSLMSALLPARIGRYEIEKELGRGTMGIVYKARDPIRGQVVALKTLSPSLVATGTDQHGFEQRFVREGAIAARLRHPGIVALRDQGRDPATSLLFLAFEYLEGQTLDLVAANARLGWAEGLRIAARLAVALHYAHERGVVHRDLKPANIMVLASGKPKIMDFGIAKVRQADRNLTVTGERLGTPLYMAPEQVLGAAVDGRSDLFSLGAILYELLTGTKPFAGPNTPKVVDRVLNATPQPPSFLVPEVDRIVLRALAKTPDDRYPSCAAFGGAVEAALAAARPQVPTAGAASRTRADSLRLLSPSDLAELQRLLDGLPEGRRTEH